MRVIVLAVTMAATAAFAQVGRIDTVGGTTYDWQMGGPAYRFIVNSVGHGIPVIWIRSLSEQSTFPDRNTGYNYYDYATRTWVFNDSNHMQSGVNAFTDRAGYGTLDVNPRDGIPYISAHCGRPIHPVVAREMGHGSGLFEYCEGPDAYLWPVTVVDTAGWVHAALIDDATRNRILHARMRTWCQWEVPHGVASPQPDPEFPCHHITASRVSHRVVLTWVFSDGAPDPGFYCETTDGGTTWGPPTELPWPPAFGGDTLPSYHISGLFPYYDRQDRFHIVTTVMPFVGTQGYVMPVEIWHWCRENDPQWSRIHRAGCDTANLRGRVGYNVLYACRPSIGEDRSGGLHVAWEQFDSLNVEPQTECLRADIFYARDNDDNGASWQEPVRLTVPDETSKRFPCIYDYTHEDTMRVLYLQDSVAGFFVQGEGNPSRNPVICQHVPITVGGVAERGRPDASRFTPNASGPTLVRGVLCLASGVERGTSWVLLDIAGRRVMDLAPGENDIRHLAPGVYFVRGEDSRAKVIIQR